MKNVSHDLHMKALCMTVLQKPGNIASWERNYNMTLLALNLKICIKGRLWKQNIYKDCPFNIGNIANFKISERNYKFANE